MSQQKSVSEFNSTAMSNLRTLIDVNTIIGDPISTASGVVIIPFSKVSFGYGTGGADLPTQANDNFAGASGGGVTIQPLGFIVIRGESVEILQVDTADNTGDRLVNASASAVNKILDLIPNKKGSSSGIKEDTDADLGEQ